MSCLEAGFECSVRTLGSHKSCRLRMVPRCGLTLLSVSSSSSLCCMDGSELGCAVNDFVATLHISSQLVTNPMKIMDMSTCIYIYI